MKTVLGEEDGAFAAAAWNVTLDGNYADEASGRNEPDATFPTSAEAT